MLNISNIALWYMLKVLMFDRGKSKQAVRQFTPYSWENFQWGYTHSFSRFVAVMFTFSLVSVSAAIMKCTKVPGTLARTYANELMCIFN